MAKESSMRKKRELPPIGTRITCKFKGKQYHALIVAASDLPHGRGVEYKGKMYSTLSSAASAITGFPTNGWRYWKW